MIEMKKDLIIWFENLRKTDIPSVGGKNASLGEMINAGIPIPIGFAVTAYSYKRFIEETGISEKIYMVIKETVTDLNDPKQYEIASKKIREIIESTPVLKDIEEAVRNAYQALCRKLNTNAVFVAVRSSATAEDLPDASFAGQQETYLNVKGEDELLEKTVKCWSSLFTPRAIFYRTEKGFAHENVFISVGIQEMVNAKAAGVTFTINPVTGDPNQIVIDGNYGLGESVVSGAVTPDNFIVDKATLNIVERRIVKKTRQYVRDPNTGKTVHTDVSPEKQEQSCLTDEEVIKLATLAKRIEEHYGGKPQDIEWAIGQEVSFPENVFIVQSRPETVWSLKVSEAKMKRSTLKPLERVVLLKGLSASPGIAAGIAKVGMTPEEVAQVFTKGDILVTRMTSPDWVPYMKIANAIVTDEGGVTCHAAVVSRELGIPCIVGARKATSTLKAGQEYTVDATSGVVYKGLVPEVEATEVEMTEVATRVVVPTVSEPIPTTGTKLYVNMSIAERAEEVAELPVDGVGLLREEFIWADEIGAHPKYLIEIGQPEKVINALAEGIRKVCQAFNPRPVVLRLSDFKTNEYRALKGGEKYEFIENNPMLGYRGACRYYSKDFEEAFRLELQAIKKVRSEFGLRNIYVEIPFCRTPEEAKKVIDIMRKHGLEQGPDLQIWMMAEIPSNIILADQFCKYIDAFSVGSNDLTQLTLGVDRDSGQLAPLFDERDPAVLRSIQVLIETAHRHGKPVSICGQAPSVYPELTEFMIRQGIDSISVNADVVISTKRLIAQIERRIMLEKSLGIKKPDKIGKLHIEEPQME